MTDETDPYQRIYALEQENARLQRKIDAEPHRKWVETDDPDVVACMGSAPPCVRGGCQFRFSDELQKAAKAILDINPAAHHLDFLNAMVVLAKALAALEAR